MANPEHLEKLKAGADEEWNDWRKANPELEPDLSHANLTNAKLIGFDLSNVNLRGTDLRGAKLAGAILDKADLSCADLRTTRLFDTFLGKTNFKGANLRGVDFTQAIDVAGVNFGFADLSNANLSNIDLIGVNFRQANLSNTNLSSANLVGAIFIGAHLVGSQLFGSNLSNAHLGNANLSEANLSEASALTANFLGATLTGACICDWNINNATNLLEVTCQYIYRKSGLDIDTNRIYFFERRPLSDTFKPGEFAKLFQKIASTIDLVFKDGINWEAFAQSYEKLRVKAGTDELKIKSIEDKEDGCFVIRVNTPPDADNAKIQQFLEAEYAKRLKVTEDRYRERLQAKDEKLDIYRQENANLWAIAQALATRPPSVTQNIDAIYGANAGNVEKGQNINPLEQ